MSYDLERPNGLLGYMLALEGISDSATMVHGPTGCKQYPADMSEKSFRVRDGVTVVRDLYSPDQRFYLYQPRLPCTYLDGRTFVSGAGDRLSELYGIVSGKNPALIGVINSPGASLIGEDLSVLDSDIPTVRIESPGYSKSLGKGFQECAIEIIKTLNPPKSEEKNGVCILGLGIWQYRWEDNIRELKRMLGLCGIEVLCTPFAGSSVEDLRKIGTSQLNVVVGESYGSEIARHLKQEYGTEYVCGTPFGFGNIESLIEKVCSALEKDPSKALEDVSAWRRKSAAEISRLDSVFVQMSGRTFSADGPADLVYAICDFMYGYLGLVPVAVSTDEEDVTEGIIDLFSKKGIPVSRDVWNTPADLTFSCGDTVSSLIARGIVHDGVDIAEPSRLRISITDDPSVGTLGTVITLQKALDIVARIAR